jgi:Icc-related predicted phosphoesterase
MKIRYISDLHLDFDKNNFWYPSECEGDLDTTLIIAGDLWSGLKHIKQIGDDGMSWLGRVSKKFKYVVYVLGNHDLYNERLDTAADKCIQLHKEQGLDNVFLLENSVITLDGVKFAGGTLWTDYGRRDSISMMEAVNYMNDYRLTRVGNEYRKMKPIDCLKIFDATKKTIFSSGADVVVTHMAPSYQSVNDKYRNTRDELSNTWYYSELSAYILDSGVKLWCHGHMHDVVEYKIGETSVVCNPRGYTGESTGFDVNAYKMLDIPPNL